MKADHDRLDGLLEAAVFGDDIDRDAYAQFRAGLLRHIGLEEKILLAMARRLRGGEPLPIANALRRDHAALASLLVPSPDRDIVGTLRALLDTHNHLEEDRGGLYDACDDLAAAAGLTADIVAALEAAPGVPVAPHVDGPLVRRHVGRVMATLAEGRGRSS